MKKRFTKELEPELKITAEQVKDAVDRAFLKEGFDKPSESLQAPQIPSITDLVGHKHVTCTGRNHTKQAQWHQMKQQILQQQMLQQYANIHLENYEKMFQGIPAAAVEVTCTHDEIYCKNYTAAQMRAELDTITPPKPEHKLDNELIICAGGTLNGGIYIGFNSSIRGTTFSREDIRKLALKAGLTKEDFLI